jgi:hypothetical protein
MKVAGGIAAVAFSVAAAVFAACGGGDGDADATPTSTEASGPTATQNLVLTPTTAVAATSSPPSVATETAEPTPETEEAPHASPIEVEPGINNLGEDSIQPVVPAGGVFTIDPVNAAQDAGIAPPPCAALVFYLAWQVRDPYPPHGVEIELYWMRMGGSELVGVGPSGQASRGCGEIQIVNNSAFDVAVEIRFAIGEITP